jgi:hypothetical protein
MAKPSGQNGHETIIPHCIMANSNRSEQAITSLLIGDFDLKHMLENVVRTTTIRSLS